MAKLLNQKLKSLFNYLYLVLLVSCVTADDTVVQLEDGNINDILKNNEVVFINFYADWCRFSQMLTPIFLDAAKTIKAEFPQEGKVVFAKVDCDAQSAIAASYHISKYPTLKLIRNGQVTKKEFRGNREAKSMASYVRDQIQDPVQQVASVETLDEIQDKHRRVIGYFATSDSDTYRSFTKMASLLREHCQFHSAFGVVSQNERTNGDNIIFRPANTRRQDQVYTGDINNVDMMLQWATDKCVPIVREITFENAEEFTEEGLPFLILFHKPDDIESVDRFSKDVARYLITEKNSINCLYADGVKFSHPLHHLGKGVNDLPILAIDSFKHMYLFKRPIADISEPGLLRQFVLDLHSGKLHREFHHGPDTVSSTPPPPEDAHKPDEPDSPSPPKHVPRKETQPPVAKKTSPPLSTFQKLKPSHDRYTILRDEL